MSLYFNRSVLHHITMCLSDFHRSNVSEQMDRSMWSNSKVNFFSSPDLKPLIFWGVSPHKNKVYDTKPANVMI